MALVNGGFLHYTDMKKFLKNLRRRNHWSDFEIISQKSGFDVSGLPDSCHNCQGQAVFTICEPGGKSKIFDLLLSIRVFIADTSSFWSLRSDKQMDIKLFTEFLKTRAANCCKIRPSYPKL